MIGSTIAAHASDIVTGLLHGFDASCLTERTKLKGAYDKITCAADLFDAKVRLAQCVLLFMVHHEATLQPPSAQSPDPERESGHVFFQASTPEFERAVLKLLDGEPLKLTETWDVKVAITAKVDPLLRQFMKVASESCSFWHRRLPSTRIEWFAFFFAAKACEQALTRLDELFARTGKTNVIEPNGGSQHSPTKKEKRREIMSRLVRHGCVNMEKRTCHRMASALVASRALNRLKNDFRIAKSSSANGDPKRPWIVSIDADRDAAEEGGEGFVLWIAQRIRADIFEPRLFYSTEVGHTVLQSLVAAFKVALDSEKIPTTISDPSSALSP